MRTIRAIHLLASLLGLLLFADCSSTYDPDVKVRTVSGVVTGVDATHQTIAIGPPRGEKGEAFSIAYTSLTIIDRPHGPSRVEDLQFGERVTVYAREDRATGALTADRIVLMTEGR
jgi:hypothetical protein